MKVENHGGRWLAVALMVSMAMAVASCQGGTDTSTGSGANIAAEPTVQRIAHDAIKVRPLGIPHDWSHRHLIFSRPSSPAMALRMEREPRYRIQQAWRQLSAGSTEAWMRALDARAVALASTPARKDGPIAWGRPLLGHPKRVLDGAWSVNLGSGAKVGAGMYPAKYSFDPIGTPNCTNDFVVFNTGLTGTATQASIVAYNNLYYGSTSSGGCGTSGVPAVYWAYNTGGRIVTSVVLSADGSQIAFIHSPTSGAASLVLLKWAPSTSERVASPASLSGVANSSYRSCTPPCMTSLTFANLFNDEASAPFYDYTNDVIYVGDGEGFVHKFMGVFKGTPAEVTGSNPWPVEATTAGESVTSPVLDGGVSPPVVYIGDSGGFLDYFTAVSTGTATVTKSGQIGRNAPDIADAPIVDSAAGAIYVMVANANDGSGNSEVFVFPRSFVSGTKGSKVAIGSADGTSPIPVYDGDFDNIYYNSSNATGNFYVCGDAGGNPTLYQVQISAGAFPSNNVHTEPSLSLASANVTCSPVTEVYNPTAVGGPFDWIFLSVQGSGSLANCSSSGCVMNFTVTAWQPSTAYSLNQEILDTNLNIEKVTTAGTSGSSRPATWNATTTADGTVVWTNQGSMGTNAASAAETGGTSGIIIDNTSTSTGASQAYFSTLTNGTCGGGCGVQVSQAGLH